MKSELEKLVGRYRELGIDRQLDHDKFYLYSIITHSTAIEGSTITELENQIMFDNCIALKGNNPPVGRWQRTHGPSADELAAI